MKLWLFSCRKNFQKCPTEKTGSKCVFLLCVCCVYLCDHVTVLWRCGENQVCSVWSLCMNVVIFLALIGFQQLSRWTSGHVINIIKREKWSCVSGVVGVCRREMLVWDDVWDESCRWAPILTSSLHYVLLRLHGVVVVTTFGLVVMVTSKVCVRTRTCVFTRCVSAVFL